MMTGWWYTYPSESHMSSSVIMKCPTEWNNNPFMFQTTNQTIMARVIPVISYKYKQVTPYLWFMYNPIEITTIINHY